MERCLSFDGKNLKTNQLHIAIGELNLKMTNKTLLAYMTKGGATEEASQTIANVLRTKFNLEVDLLNLKKQPSPDITSYNNVIIGSGVRTGKIYKEALKLLEQDFKEKKVAFFICFCYLSSLKTSQSKDDKSQSRDQIVDLYIKTVLARLSQGESNSGGSCRRMHAGVWKSNNRSN